MMVENECVQGAKNEGRIKALEDRADKNDVEHGNFGKAIEEIRDRLLNRPTPQMAALIALLSSACVGLIVAMVAG